MRAAAFQRRRGVPVRVRVRTRDERWRVQFLLRYARVRQPAIESALSAAVRAAAAQPGGGRARTPVRRRHRLVRAARRCRCARRSPSTCVRAGCVQRREFCVDGGDAARARGGRRQSRWRRICTCCPSRGPSWCASALPLLVMVLGVRLAAAVRARAARRGGRPQPARIAHPRGDRRDRAQLRAARRAARRAGHRAASASASPPTCTTTSAPSC